MALIQAAHRDNPGGRPGIRMATRAIRTALGWTQLVVGAVLFPLPGPGMLLLAIGMTLLAQEYPWAEHRVDRFKRLAMIKVAHGVRTLRKAVCTLSLTIAITLAGVPWVWSPEEPRWWALPTWTWLPGGFWAGISHMFSGLVTLALVLYGWRRFHGHPERVAALEAEVGPKRSDYSVQRRRTSGRRG